MTYISILGEYFSKKLPKKKIDGLYKQDIIYQKVKMGSRLDAYISKLCDLPKKIFNGLYNTVGNGVQSRPEYVWNMSRLG